MLPVSVSCDSLPEVEERHGDPAQSLNAAPLLPLLFGSSRRGQTAGIQSDGQLRLSRELVDLHRETHPDIHTHTHMPRERQVRRRWANQ